MLGRTDQSGKGFKKGIDPVAARRLREDTTISIRKAKREESLQKRRNFSAAVPQSTPSSTNTTPLLVAEIPNLVAALRSDNQQAHYEATQKFRKMLSIPTNPPIAEVIASGVVPRFVEFLQHEHNAPLQFEAAWALTNIASGSSAETQEVVNHGAVPLFVKLLESPNADVREQAVWALGNIAGDNPQSRDLVLHHGIMSPLLYLIQSQNKLSLVRNATWTLSNCCRGKPEPDFNAIRCSLPTLNTLITSSDKDILTDACWALSYISDGPNEKIQAVIEQEGLVPTLVQLLMHRDTSVLTPALRVIGNVVTGDDHQTQMVIDSNALPCLLSLLYHQSKGIKKETCWTISNITAGNQAQIEAVIKNNLMQPLIQKVGSSTEYFEVKKEAAWAICNATTGATPEQIRFLVRQGCIPPLVQLLACNDARITLVALESLENILRLGEKEPDAEGNNPYAIEIDLCDGVEKIEELQLHENNDIYQCAMNILRRFFQGEEEAAGVAPGETDSQFVFSSNTGGQPNNFMF